MKLSLLSPTKALLSSYTEEELYLLKKQLTYTNTGIKHLIKRHHAQHFWKSRNLDTWEAHLENLKRDLTKYVAKKKSPGLKPISERAATLRVRLENRMNGIKRSDVQ